LHNSTAHHIHDALIMSRHHHRCASGIDALEQATSHIARNPGTGSPRYGHELNLPGLRSWPLKRFEHLLFYVEHEGHIDLWRVLHNRSDIPAWMNEPDAGSLPDPSA
jgi:toxin ParE1/3/4